MILISYFDLAMLAILVLLLGLVLSLNGFSEVKGLWWSTTRMGVQLLFMGFWLSYVFSADNVVWVALISFIMLLIGAYEISKRQEYRFKKTTGIFIGLIALSMTSLVLLIGVLTLVIKPQPWYEPQYVIPLLGMLLGNSMTSIGLALDGLSRQAVQARAKIEAQLALGRNAKEAIAFIRQQSLHTAMIPLINMLVAAGLVSLPGMLTGQILAGVDPIEAVKYQIMIMLLIVTSAGFGTLIALNIASKKLFDARERLRLSVLVR